MLEYLRLKNTGPAHEMEIEFAPRVNLLDRRQRSRQELPAGHRVVGAHAALATGSQPQHDVRAAGPSR